MGEKSTACYNNRNVEGGDRTQVFALEAMKPALPTLRLSWAEFVALPEYSASLPTGTRIGKRWRRLDGAHDQAFIRAGGKPRWKIGEYTRDRIISAYRDERHPMGVGERNPADPKGPLINHQCRIKAVTEITWYRPVISVQAAAKATTPGSDAVREVSRG